MKGWLTDTIDAWLKDEKARIEEENDRKYKSIILKQKNEIEQLKRKSKQAWRGTENSVPDSMRSPAGKGKAKFANGSKEYTFVSHLEELKPRVESMSDKNKEECKAVDEKLAQMKSEIQQWELNNDVIVTEIEDLKREGKDAVEYAQGKAKEFEDFENEIKEWL